MTATPPPAGPAGPAGKTLVATVLSFTPERDSQAFADGCRRVGFDLRADVRKKLPTDAEIASVFAAPAHFMLLNGHQNQEIPRWLGNAEFRGGDASDTDESVGILVDGDTVSRSVKVGAGVQAGVEVFDRRSKGINSAVRCQVIMLGASNMVDDGTFTTGADGFFTAAHVYLGFNSHASWRMLYELLATGQGHGDFFGKLIAKKGKSKLTDAAVDSWLEAAAATPSMRPYWPRVSARDESGRMWGLDKSGVPGVV